MHYHAKLSYFPFTIVVVLFLDGQLLRYIELDGVSTHAELVSWHTFGMSSVVLCLYTVSIQ